MVDRDAILRLHAALDARATAKSRAFWQGYLKGEAEFRGVPMGEVRNTLHRWWNREGIGGASVSLQKKTALSLFEGLHTEDRLAGVLALSEILLGHLDHRDLPAFARLFRRGRIADWNLCDWFCVKVLAKMLDHCRDPVTLAAKIGAWRRGKVLWQRRAACVAFVPHAASGGGEDIPNLVEVVLASCEALVHDQERFAQTGVGWVLRELSLHDRDVVLAFAERHLELLSREAVRSLSEKMPPSTRKRLVAAHARVG